MNVNSFTDVIVAMISLATIAVLVTRPGVASVFKGIGTYLSGAIRATLGN